MGDFNLDLLQVNSHKETDDFLNILGSSFFLPQILQPTRITYHLATLIDNIFFNSLEHFTISGNIAYDLTDHLANFLIFNKFDSLPSGVKLFRRDYSTLNQQALISEIQLIDWQQVFRTDSNPSSMFSSFYSEVSSIIDRHTCCIHVDCTVKKFRRNIGILSKIRLYVSQEILLTLYYGLVYPFLIYGLIAWVILMSLL